MRSRLTMVALVLTIALAPPAPAVAAPEGQITFAINIARWLSDNGRPKEVLLYDDGVIQSSFDVDLSFGPPPFPPIEALVPLANQMIGEMEQEDKGAGPRRRRLLSLLPGVKSGVKSAS